MTKLGYCKMVLTTEEEIKAAVRCCLRALDHLHSHNPPLMHCDVRLANILWGPEPFLTDLELAHRAPWKVLTTSVENMPVENMLKHLN